MEKGRDKFIKELKKIHEFCDQNGIKVSFNTESFFFNIRGQNFIVTSNKGNWCGDRGQRCIVINANRFRFIDIYNDLKDGYLLDEWGRRVGDIEESKTQEIIKFCENHNIEYSIPLYSYYFTLGEMAFLVLPDKQKINLQTKVDEKGDPTIYFWHDRKKVEEATIIKSSKWLIKKVYNKLKRDIKNGQIQIE